MLVRKILFLISFLFTVPVFPQGEAAIPFLLLPTSPKLNGAGAAGTASLIDDPYKVFFNPAHLGQSSVNSGFSTGFYPGKIDWLGSYQLTLNSYVFNYGINLKNIFAGLPLSAGISYSRSELNFGTFNITTDESPEPIGTFESKDYYSAYSLGIGYHSIVNISAGLTVKDITSVLGLGPAGPLKADVTAVDYGILLNIPLNNFISKYLSYNIDRSSYIQADLNYTLGYTIQNIGDKVYYVNSAQSDPIGRTARLAHSINIGINLETALQRLNLVNFFYSIDAEDILIKTKVDTLTAINNSEYEGMFGTIKPFKNLFLGKNDRDIVLHKGLTVEFLESVYFAWGGFDGRGFSNRKTNGFGIRAMGILKLINYSQQSAVLKYITDHFDVQYSSATYFAGHLFESEFQGVTISVTGF